MLHDVVNCTEGRPVRLRGDRHRLGRARSSRRAPPASTRGASAIYSADRRRSTRSALEFGITGIAKGVDKNHDGKIDEIQTGTWAGTLAYGGTACAARDGTFTGERM